MAETLSARSSKDKHGPDFLALSRHFSAGAWEHDVSGRVHVDQEPEVRKRGDTRARKAFRQAEWGPVMQTRHCPSGSLKR